MCDFKNLPVFSVINRLKFEQDVFNDENFVVKCPHCNDIILIDKVNCTIFRHGVLKDNFNQINPHLQKIECDKLKNENKIYGCGKPFRLQKVNNQWIAIICDYI